MAASLTTFLFELANFVLFAVLLGWLFIKPVREFLESQAESEAEAKARIQGDQRAAAELRAEAALEKQELAKEREVGRQTALAEVRQEAQRLKEQAQLEIERLRQRWEREKQQALQHEHLESSRQVAQVAAQAVTHLLKMLDMSDLRGRLIRSACQKLQNMKSICDEPIIIESAFPLEKQQEVEIRESVLGCQGSIQFRQDPTLIDGIKIYCCAGMIDHSLAGLAQFAEREFRKQWNADG